MKKFVIFSGILILMSCERVPLDQQLVSHDARIREKGFQKLARSSLSNKRQIALKLTAFAKNEDGRIANRATNALVAMGEPAIEPLSTLIKDSDVYVRLNAIAALGEIGPAAQFATPALLECLNDPHPLIREESVYTLGRIETDGSSIGGQISAIAQNDPNEDVRAMANETLKKLGLPNPSRGRS